MTSLKEKVGIYAGSFDPITNGHIDIIKRSMQICHRLIILIGINSSKKTLFTEGERILLIQKALDSEKSLTEYNILVKAHSGFVVEMAKQYNVSILIRGIRSVSDFEYETNLANINKILAPQIETVFLPTSPELAVVSSSMVKEIAKFNGSINQFVSAPVAQAVYEKFSNDAK